MPDRKCGISDGDTGGFDQCDSADHEIAYIGVAFIDTFFLLFCMRYTHKKIPKHLVGVMLVVDILVMISAWTSQYHSLF